jgi:uncharacterized repeat protein (TIGR01451 family)
MRQCRVAANAALTVSIFLIMAGLRTTFGQFITIPERLGVVDIIPNIESAEANDNSDSSFGMAGGAKYGDVLLSTRIPPESMELFISADLGAHWGTNGLYSGLALLGAVDWSEGGTAYFAIENPPPWVPHDLTLAGSIDPITIPIGGFSNYLASAGLRDLRLKVANIGGVDQIYMGINDGNSPIVNFSVDGSRTWSTTSIERTTPGVYDGPAVPVAVSSDGLTVYALFERLQNNLISGDQTGDIVLVRDDVGGLTGFYALPINGNGGNDGAHDTEVARDIVIPEGNGAGYGTPLGSQPLGRDCSVAVSPLNAGQVYVAYDEVVAGSPVLRVQSSSDGGKTFQLVYSVSQPAAMPALAVAEDGTVGILFLELAGLNFEVHLLKAAKGDFTKTNELVLTRFPDTDYLFLGTYFQLKAEGDNFFGVFSAPNDPQPGHFPAGVFYQRNVEVNGTIESNFWLSSTGTNVDLGGTPVVPSVDPFFFYDIASQFIRLPILEYVPRFFYDPSDPLSGVDHIRWPVLPAGYPQYHLESSPLLGGGANWLPARDVEILQNDGMFSASLGVAQTERFFRLNQNAASGNFNLYATADGHGNVEPSGVSTKGGLQTQTFNALPGGGYGFKQWFLDGTALPSSSSTLLLGNIDAEHFVLATFIASNDLAVVVSGPVVPVLVNSNISWNISVLNAGLNPLTNVRLSNSLPSVVTFVSASSSQGTVSPSSPGTITGNLGSLAPGALAAVTITATAIVAVSITDIVNASCDQSEPNLANNTAQDVVNVIVPVTITSQPQSQSVPTGTNVTFTVGSSGTPPIGYQWFFNGAGIIGATNTSMTLSNVTAVQNGSYSAELFQLTGPHSYDGIETNSLSATLTVGP